MYVSADFELDVSELYLEMEDAIAGQIQTAIEGIDADDILSGADIETVADNAVHAAISENANAIMEAIWSDGLRARVEDTVMERLADRLDTLIGDVIGGWIEQHADRVTDAIVPVLTARLAGAPEPTQEPPESPQTGEPRTLMFRAAYAPRTL